MTFFNTVLQLVIVNILVWRTELSSKLWSADGLGNDLWFFQLLAILDVVTEMLKPKYLIKLYQRWNLQKTLKGVTQGPSEDGQPQFETNTVQVSTTQEEANDIFSNFDFCYDEKLSKYCKLLLICFSICALFPLAPLISLIYLFIYYWVDKVFLIRLAKVPSFCTSKIGHSMLRFFDFALVVYTGGYLLFYNIIDGQSENIQVALFIIACFILGINVHFIVKLIFGEKKDEQVNNKNLDFEQAKVYFHCNTYELCNPVDKLRSALQMYKGTNFFDLRDSRFQ